MAKVTDSLSAEGDGEAGSADPRLRAENAPSNRRMPELPFRSDGIIPEAAAEDDTPTGAGGTPPVRTRFGGRGDENLKKIDFRCATQCRFSINRN
jgi:hypothetical protein